MEVLHELPASRGLLGQVCDGHRLWWYTVLIDTGATQTEINGHAFGRTAAVGRIKRGLRAAGIRVTKPE